MTELLQWFGEQSLAKQLLVLALVFDPLGLALGVLLHYQFALDLYVGLATGLVIASTP